MHRGWLQRSVCIVCIVIIFVYVLTVERDGTQSMVTTFLSNGGDGEPRGYVRIPELNPNEVPVDRAMFFIETNRRPAIRLTARQACSVESAARMNPDRLVYVLFLSSSVDSQNDTMTILSLLINYKNIRLRFIDLFTYTTNTPLENFVHSGIMEKGKWLLEQHSDMLRILTLWKFGGIYMDLDVVSIKPIPLINCIGAEYPGEMLASCVIGIQNKSVAERALELFKSGWDGENWVKNGPLLLTNLMKEQCESDNVEFMYSGKANCKNFTIFSPNVFCPIPWYDWEIYFDETKNEFVKQEIHDSMAVHFWNKMSKDRIIIPTSKQPYAEIANKYCPKVMSTVINYF